MYRTNSSSTNRVMLYRANNGGQVPAFYQALRSIKKPSCPTILTKHSVYFNLESTSIRVSGSPVGSDVL